MPVEIRELVIKCEVRSDVAERPPTASMAARGRPLSRELLAAIDRRVDEALRRARER